jgi:hypothetical protein
MVTLRFAVLALCLAYGLLSDAPTKQGGGWDPLGLTASPPPPAENDQGSGWDPWG